jgi:multiple sugar transport system permease protein
MIYSFRAAPWCYSLQGGRGTMKTDKRTPWLYILPYLFFFSIFFIIPFFYGVAISFTNFSFSDETKFIALKNYINIFSSESIYSGRFWSAIKNTFIFIVLSVPCLIIVPLILAQMLHKCKKWGGFFQSIFYMPTLFSVTSAMLVWTWLMNNETGIVNYYLDMLFHFKIQWLTTTWGAWTAIVIATVWWTMGSNLIIFTAGINQISKEQYEAADIDGANEIAKFFAITIPGLKHQLIYAVLMTIIASSNLFGQPDIMTKGGPGYETYSITMLIREVAFTGTVPRAGQAAAMSIVFGLMIIAVSFLAAKYINKAINENGVDGYEKERGRIQFYRTSEYRYFMGATIILGVIYLV